MAASPGYTAVLCSQHSRGAALRSHRSDSRAFSRHCRFSADAHTSERGRDHTSYRPSVKSCCRLGFYALTLALQKPIRANPLNGVPSRESDPSAQQCVRSPGRPLCAPRGPHPALSPSVCQVIGVYDYSAQNDDELAFSKGQIINVLNKDDPDWWRGEVNGQVGLFPSNYVKLTADTDPSQQCKCPGGSAASPSGFSRSHVRQCSDSAEPCLQGRKPDHCRIHDSLFEDLL